MPQCPQCQTDNDVAARFCNQCGTRLGDSVPTLVTAAPRNYTPRHLAERVLNSRAALQGERKRVTVMFVDIKDSTRLALRAGPEAWHEILDHYFALLSGAVHRFEGTVNQYTGDGIMALFGAPIAHEDDAQRACRAALQLQREVRRYAEDLRLKSGINLSARVGLNTGEVIVGAIGDDLRMDYTAQGLTVHLAARLEHLCEPGHVYVSRSTAVLVEGYFKLRDLGETEVQGSDDPVRVYALEGEGPAQSRLQRALARGAARFVGRDAELATLHAALHLAREGQAQIVSLAGTAGLGKSRLCHEFALAAETAGVSVLRASGVPYASAVPFHPVQTLVRERLGLSEQGEAEEQRRLAAGALLLFDAEAAALLPALLNFLGLSDAANTPRTPEELSTQRSQLFALFIRLLTRNPRPQLLLIEDLHFFDAGSEAFLMALAASLGNSRNLLLCNFRPDYEAAWLEKMAHERLELAALGDAQIAALASELLGADPSLASLPTALAKRAMGNPLFVEESVQSLLETGHLSGPQGGYTLLRPIAEWPIPDTIHALVAARIDRLGEAEKALLQTAAIIGQQFCQQELAELRGIGKAECLRLLQQLQLRCFVQVLPDSNGEWQFCHALTHDVAYHAQLGKSRIAMHGRVAELLAAQRPVDAAPSEQAVRIAHHYTCAERWLKAAGWNLVAARWAAAQDANLTAEQFQNAARHAGMAEASPEADRMRVQALSGVLRMAQFADLPPEQAEQAYGEARAIAMSRGDNEALAELLVNYATEHLRRGDAAQAVQVAAEAVALALQAGALQIIERHRLSLLLIHSAAGYPREGLALIESVSGRGWLEAPIDHDNFMSRGFAASMLTWEGRLGEAKAQLDAALYYVREHQRPVSWLHATVVDLAWFTGNTEGVLAAARLSMRQAEAHGSSYFRAISLRALGEAHLLLGDPAAALPLLEQALPLVSRGSTAYQFEARTLTTLAEVQMALHQTDAAKSSLQRAVSSAASSHSPVWQLMALLASLELPDEAASSESREAALLNIERLIAQTGALGLRPWYWKAKAHWAKDAVSRSAAEAQALAGLEAMGALPQRQRWQSVFAGRQALV